MIRAVIDTNILVSALISKKTSPPFRIYHLIKSENFLLITSPTILEELEDVISREEIIKLHRRTKNQIKEILKELVETSYIVPGLVSAEYIITGDKPLLNIKEYHGIKIISPTEFVKRLGKMFQKSPKS